MSHSDTIPLHPSSQSDIDEIENLIHSYPSSVSPHVPRRPHEPPSPSPPIPFHLRLHSYPPICPRPPFPNLRMSPQLPNLQFRLHVDPQTAAAVVLPGPGSARPPTL
ncbi:hypothetical protein PHJA_001470600 [Phtheirospermum japonicum]|uniref:Uncharacterized protein n=1 Tax=Phtheirospermum japonicum TaxID=374723 RepID=A0A830C509_9LAMI|nr:hypothetical protein PHJA_001470600 [Phtheirospermum japonicum]